MPCRSHSVLHNILQFFEYLFIKVLESIVFIKHLLSLRHSTRHGVKFTFLNTISSRRYYPDFKDEKTESQNGKILISDFTAVSCQDWASNLRSS